MEINDNKQNKLLKSYKKYVDLLNLYRKKLNEEDNPYIENDEYDKLKRKIEEIESKYPEIIDRNSPLHNIGVKISSELKTVKHDVKMESLHDSFSLEEIKKFFDKTNSRYYVVEPKIDGLSISVIYEFGVLKLASTRGDGYVGENVTEKIKKIKNLPHRLKKDISFLEVRGEVFMPKSEFKKLTEKYEEFDGTQAFKNPRNAASGILRNKNLKIIESYNLKILIFNVEQLKINNFKFKSPWEISSEKKIPFKTHLNSLSFIKKLGLPVIESSFCISYEDIIKKIERIKKEKIFFDFQVDGAVVKINELARRAQLGSTDIYPRWAEAFKYKPEEKVTKLLSIETQIGRSGVLTPVAIFDNIILSGSCISKATLHNYDYVSTKDIRIGDYVRVRKAGDIIPEVVGYVEKLQVTANDEKDLKIYHNSLPVYKIPEFCPFCDFRLQKKQNEVAIRCINDYCSKKIIEKIVHFASKNAMDIEILGNKTIEKLVSNGILKKIEDIYKINAEVLYKKDMYSVNKINSKQLKFDEFEYDIYLKKDIKKVIEKIKESKNRPLNKLIYALGIPYIGQEISMSLAKKFKEFKNLIKARKEDLESINGLGEIGAESIIDFFKKNKFEYFEKINFKQI